MPTFSELYPICLLLIAFLATGWLLLHRYPISDDIQARDIQVDGLRGLLAFGVMTYHYSFIRNLIHDSEQLSNVAKLSILNDLIGPWAVHIFFAITAYLFSSRFVSLEDVKLDWLRFYIGRLFRLIPVCTVCALLMLISMNEAFLGNSSSVNYKENWLCLTNLASSSIRKSAGYIIFEDYRLWNNLPVGPHWTLKYEWNFYVLLPVLGLLFRLSRSILWVLISILLMLFVMKDVKVFFTDWSTITWAFLPGLILGLTSKHWKNSRYLRHPITAFTAITAIVASAFYGNLKVKIPANTLFLAIILSNNTATRLLESKLLRSLGETTYSIYLLHGIVQYVTLKWIVTIPTARNMPDWLWWLTCVLQVVVIVVIARLSFEYVEKPGIEGGKRFYSWLMNLIERRAKWLRNWI
jgi:peptidoglycan/LPS O-acetylase OafA/YrhL